MQAASPPVAYILRSRGLKGLCGNSPGEKKERFLAPLGMTVLEVAMTVV
jgi:hypothetical protein